MSPDGRTALARLRQAIARLEEIMAEMEEALFGRLLDTRNLRWIETLEPKLAEGDRVVAVGALHLGGETGLLRLLEDRGFTVRRLPE